MPTDTQTYDVELTVLVYGGDALGRLPDGRAVFVPFGLAGELVRVRLVEDKARHARAHLLEVLRLSAERITPRCPHFGVCGGCQYQQLNYNQQVLVKQAVVIEQLTRLGGIANPPVEAVRPSPQAWNYRNTLQFHLSPQGKLGFLAAGTNRVVEIEQCLLPQPPLDEIWKQLDFASSEGLERVELRLGAGEDVLLTLEGSEPPELNVELEISAVHIGPAGTLVLAGDGATVMDVLGRPFQVSAGAFFQVNTAQAEAMVQHVLAVLPLTETSTVLDVYCGVGLFSAFLAQRAGRVIGIELDETACGDFAVNLDEFDNVELYQGAAENVLPGLDVQPNAILVDPPRAGLERAALDALVQMHPPLLVYISCDPATLARDVKRLLQAGYTLERVTPFDMFPQTAHIESISVFRAI